MRDRKGLPSAQPAPSERKIFPHASGSKRLIAAIIDSFVVSVLVMVITILGGLIGLGGWTSIAALLSQAIYCMYFWKTTGATPGKSLLHLKVVDLEYETVDIRTAFLRYLGYFVSSICLMLGYIWILIDGANQGWHDKIADTYVIDTSIKS
jgi:uncharacterized RDD family membrane protein YckC